MLRMMRPSFACCSGTLTPAMVASTTMCGVCPLSLIHSCIARPRYGRFDTAAGASELILRLTTAGSQPHLLFAFGETLLERRAREDPVHVCLDGAALGRDVDVVHGQAPEDGRDARVHQRELVAEEEFPRGEDVRALQDRLLQHLARAGGLLLLAGLLDLLRQ